MPGLPSRLVAALAVGLVLMGLQVTVAGQRLEHGGGLAGLYWLRGSAEAPDDAVILALDDAGAEWVGFHARAPGRVSAMLEACLTPEDRKALSGLANALSLPRVLHACALQALTAAGARVVAFDVVFRRAGDAAEDARLAGAMAAARVAGTAVVLLEGVDAQAGGLLRRERPQETLRSAASATGMFRVGADSTGLVVEIEERLEAFPDLGSFPGAALAAYRDDAGAAAVPEGQLPWYYGPPGSLATLSLPALFADDPAMVRRRAALAGRAVFVGLADPTRVGEKDHFRTVVTGGAADAMPGVEIAATVFLNRLEGPSLSPVSVAAGLPAGWLEGLLTALAGALGVLVVAGRSGWAGALAALGLSAGLVALSAALFIGAALWLPVVVPAGGLAVIAVVVALRGYARTRAGLSARLPPPVAQRVRARDGAEALELRPVIATVMFVDVAGSTSLAEAMGAPAYAAALTAFQSAAARAVADHGGIVVEIEGDGLLAAFPATAGDAVPPAARACLAARAVAEAAATGSSGGVGQALALRIGIEEGEVMLGETEAGGRLGLRVIGDPVNAAERLQREAKARAGAAGSTVVVSDRVAAGARGALGIVSFLPAGETVLSGRQGATVMWKLTLNNSSKHELY